MKPRLRTHRQSGVLLLMVALILASIAALSFSMNRAATMELQSIQSDYEKRNAAYLAEAAVAAAKWTNQVDTKCGRASFTPITLANATLSANITRAPPKAINVIATAATAAGANATLTRDQIHLFDLTNSQTKNLGGEVLDTYVDPSLGAMNTSTNLVVTSGQSNALIFWPMTDIPANSAVLSAQLILHKNGIGTLTPTVNVHRMTTQWVANATWSSAQPGVAWKGGNYSAAVIASTRVNPGATTWDVTGLVDGWVSGRLANYGLLLRLPDPGKSVTFYSMDAMSSMSPVLRVKFSTEC